MSVNSVSQLYEREILFMLHINVCLQVWGSSNKCRKAFLIKIPQVMPLKSAKTRKSQISLNCEIKGTQNLDVWGDIAAHKSGCWRRKKRERELDSLQRYGRK